MWSIGAITLFLGAVFISAITARHIQQPVINDIGPVMPPATSDPSGASPVAPPTGDTVTGGTVILCDVLGRDRSINIFAGLTRDIESIDKRLSDGLRNTTVLAPLNSAIVALPRKPWESNEDYNRLGTDAYEGRPGEDRAHANLRRFVEEHVVPESPWQEGTKIKTLAGSEVWWEMKDGKRTIQPGNIEVTSVASKVANGQVWIMNDARNYA